MPATVIAERIGWEHGMTILRDRVAQLRPLFLPPDPSQRTHYRPGELVQFDLWQPETPIPLGFDQAAKLWVVTAVCGYSRFMAAWMVPTWAAHDVLFGMLRCFEQIGARPAAGGDRLVVEVDHESVDDGARPAGRVWLVRLRRGNREVVGATELGRPSADHLATRIADVVSPRRRAKGAAME